MDILSLKITNFLTIGDAPKISLQDQGLVLIQGINEDDTSATSNGAGKSSIADALCWALYGTTARDESGDAVVNTTAKKNCSVRVYLQDGATTYEITRYRKHKEFKNQTVVKACSTGTVWVDISKGTETETQRVITEIMGCSLDVFTASIYAGQEAMPDLPKMTDKQLKLLIEEAAGVERIEAAYEIARARFNSAKDGVANTQSWIERILAQIETQKLDLTGKRLEFEGFEKGREARSRVFRDNAESHKGVLIANLKTLKGIDTDALNKRNDELSKLLGGHSELLQQRDEKKKRQEEAVRKYDSAKYRLDSLTDEAQKLKGTYDNAEEEIKKPCPQCGKPGDEHDLESYRKHVKTRLLEAVTNAKSQKETVATLQAMVETITADLAEFEKTIPDVSELTREQGEINARLLNHGEIKTAATKEKAEMDRQNELAAAAMTETNPHASAVESIEKRLGESLGELTKYQKTLSEQQEALEVFADVVKVFGPAGVRAHILDTVTPFLNESTADYLSALSDGNISATWTTLATTAKGDLKEKFSIEVSNDRGGKTFKSLSGGEKRKVRLAAALALQDLVSSRATKPINIWIGDEIDDALDPAGLERLMSILERKARERGTVLVISHNELKSWVDTVLSVTKRGGLSTIEGALVE